GFRDDGLPFGITLIAPAWQDDALIKFGKQWQNINAFPLGATKKSPPVATKNHDVPAGYLRLAVVSAHLSGMPLNSQLTERHALFVEQTRTANCYQLFALPDTTP